jgi:hypothetical protein
MQHKADVLAIFLGYTTNIFFFIQKKKKNWKGKERKGVKRKAWACSPHYCIP